MCAAADSREPARYVSLLARRRARLLPPKEERPGATTPCLQRAVDGGLDRSVAASASSLGRRPPSVGDHDSGGTGRDGAIPAAPTGMARPTASLPSRRPPSGTA